MGAAPECCSFSRAVTPAVRSALRPEGLPQISENMQRKVQVGNSHAQFLLELLVICQEMGLLYWVENPDGSFLWLLIGARRVLDLQKRPSDLTCAVTILLGGNEQGLRRTLV